MAPETRQSSAKSVWGLAAEQHGVVAVRQLYGLGLTEEAVRHRVARGRLHRLRRGVYAVGRPEVTRYGHWMAAVLSCGSTAVLSHGSAAALWGIREPRRSWGALVEGRGELYEMPIDVSVRTCSHRGVVGVRLHRRGSLREADVGRHEGIPLTSPTQTLIDLAARLDEHRLERAVNQADKLDLVDPVTLLESLDGYSGRDGVGRLRSLLAARVFRLTDSELERRFLRLVRAARMPLPRTGARVNGFEVDFYWPEIGLVVETDGLRYHRTPAQQARDQERDQIHAIAGLSTLRFTHHQVYATPDLVERRLGQVIRRLESAAA